MKTEKRRRGLVRIPYEFFRWVMGLGIIYGFDFEPSTLDLVMAVENENAPEVLDGFMVPETSVMIHQKEIDGETWWRLEAQWDKVNGAGRTVPASAHNR